MSSKTEHRLRWLALVLLLVIVTIAGVTHARWWPQVLATVDAVIGSQRIRSPNHAEEAEHEHHTHGHAAHKHGQSLELTAQALKNLGLTPEYLQPITLSNYQRTISIPAIVVARPGRTQIQVSSPLSGVVLHVHAVTGQAVMPGDLLFKVRLTHEELVETQTQFLKSLSELEVENREIARLEEVVRTGAVPGKSLIERNYAKEKLLAYLTSLRESLKLHGLSADQIHSIETERKLMRDLSIVAPDIDTHDHQETLRLSQFRPANFRLPESSARHATPPQVARPLVIEDLKVHKGQGVTSGEMLCTLSDYSELYIEGQAFEQDAPSVAMAAEKGWTLDALLPTIDGHERLSQLKLAYVANAVDSGSRTLSFFVELPNQILRDELRDEGHRFVSWKHRLGQRMQLLVPVEIWQQQIVLPVDAVVNDGADWFVFKRKGGHFDRVAVHVKYRDQQNVVIDNDGSIVPGNVVARRSAHQLQMALQNKLGSGADPHAGHSH